MRSLKNSRLNVRVSRDEHELITARAASAGLSVSDYVRKCALQDSGRPIIRTDAETLARLYANLRRAGGNLNQCAYELNKRHKPNEVEIELEQAFKAVAHASEDVSAFLADARNSI